MFSGSKMADLIWIRKAVAIAARKAASPRGNTRLKTDGRRRSTRAKTVVPKRVRNAARVNDTMNRILSGVIGQSFLKL